MFPSILACIISGWREIWRLGSLRELANLIMNATCIITQYSRYNISCSLHHVRNSVLPPYRWFTADGAGNPFSSLKLNHTPSPGPPQDYRGQRSLPSVSLKGQGIICTVSVVILSNLPALLNSTLSTDHHSRRHTPSRRRPSILKALLEETSERSREQRQTLPSLSQFLMTV